MTEENTEELTRILLLQNKVEETLNKASLFGEISEEHASFCIASLLTLHEKKQEEHSEKIDHLQEDDVEIEDIVLEKPSFELIISTEGGLVSEMFGIYDVMRRVQAEGTDIQTFGVGKVMSAGVLLLAAGTKGHRLIGKSTQVMMHEVSSGHFGSVREIQNDAKQTKYMREQYIKALASETSLSTQRIKRIFAKRVDEYFTAEEAIKMGIADIIV